MYTKEYYEENKDRYRENNKRWREANHEKFMESQIKWRANNEGRTYMQGKYLVYVGFQHPACHKFGITPVHKLVLWDKLAGQDAKCNWCDKDIFWNSDDWNDKLVADHVDTNKVNNEPSNLVPSCNRCNLTRGQKSDSSLPCTFDGCDRPQDSFALCRTHYQQQYNGLELKPIRDWNRPEVKTDTHRQCTKCKEVKTIDEFYQSKGHVKAACKKCTIKINDAANKRRRLEGR